MSSVNYYAKYLKYKKKYLDLVNHMNNGGADKPKTTKELNEELNKKPPSSQKVPKGTECNMETVPQQLCKHGQFCNYGYCEDATVKDPVKTANRENAKNFGKSAAEIQRDQVNAEKKAADEKKKEDEKQRGGYSELDINELLSESSFN